MDKHTVFFSLFHYFMLVLNFFNRNIQRTILLPLCAYAIVLSAGTVWAVD